MRKIKKHTHTWDVIVHKILQISPNTICNHLDFDMDGDLWGFQTFISPSWYTTADLWLHPYININTIRT